MAADESKLASEIISLDTEEEKLIHFDFSEDLDAGRVLTGTPTITTSAGLTITFPTSSGDKAQCLLNTGATAGTYIVKCIATDDGATTQTFVGRGTVKVS